MSADLEPADCPVCHSAGSVTGGRCQLCDATFGEIPDGAVDLPPAVPSEPAGGGDAPGEPRPLLFSDVIAELKEVGALVSSADGALEVEAACGRLQALLQSLRLQFLTDVVLAEIPRLGGRQPKRPVT